MDRMRAQLARARDDDDGMSLVEVIMAMIVFALVSVGLVYTMISTMAMTRDSRARESATNLAAEEVDLARAAADPFTLLDSSRTVSLNGDTFDVERKTQWVSDPEDDFTCGSSGASGSALRYKRINVTVTWGTMRKGAQPVTTNTLLNPDEHINDPTKGTILVSVLNAAGTGAGGVTVTASPSVGSVIAPTDSQGCTYILKVAPGTYSVAVQKSGYISDKQNAVETQTVTVTAGGSSSLGFQMDSAGEFRTKLAPGASPKVATNVMATFVNTYGRFSMTPSSGAGTTTPYFKLHPFPAGYRVFAGECLAADPVQWPQATVGADTIRGVETAAVASDPGSSVSVDVDMGLVNVAGDSSKRYLKAVSVNPGGTTPGCDSTVTYTFGQILPTSTGSKVLIALPYGTWQLYKGSSATAMTTLIGNSSITAQSPAVPKRTSIAADGTITLDPRVVVTP